MTDFIDKYIRGPVNAFIRQDADYYRENKRRVTLQNDRMLRLGSIIYLLILVMYTAAVYFTKTSAMLLFMYCGFGVANLILTVVAFTRSEKSRENFRITQLLCGVFEILILSFFAAEGVFPFPDTHSLYVPIALFLVLHQFSHGVRYSFGLIVIYCVGYGLAAALYKSPEIAMNDARIAIATFIAASINTVLLSRLRSSEGRAMKNMEYLSTMDSLTGIYNRQTVDRLCSSYIEGRNEDNAEPYALLLIDLDHFKSINDTCGHAAGDEALRLFGTLLRSHFYDRDFVGRYGGDEFLVVISGPSLTADIVAKKAQSLLDETAGLPFEQEEISLSCSIGIVYTDSRDGAETVEHVIARADEALYTAKSRGKSRYVFADTEVK